MANREELIGSTQYLTPARCNGSQCLYKDVCTDMCLCVCVCVCVNVFTKLLTGQFYLLHWPILNIHITYLNPEL